MEEKIYTGFLRHGSNGEDFELLMHNDEILAETLEEIHCKMVTVRYYISDKEVTLEEAQKAHLLTVMGAAYVEYEMHYSEITGYLWTDEELQIGGHDLMEELKSHIGKYLILIITIEGDQEKKTNNTGEVMCDGKRMYWDC